jgi:hypothetical protein
MLFLLLACKAPIVAPEDMDSLLDFFYIHMEGEQEEALLAGVSNLYTFVDNNRSELEGGFDVSPLSLIAMETTGESTEYLDDMYGVSLLYGVPYPVEDIAWCYTAVDLVDIYPDRYLSYERELFDDLDCFLSQECNTFSYRSTILSSLPLNAEITTVNRVEMRWLQTERGLAFIQKTWMEGEAEASVDWANLLGQNYLEITWMSDGGSNSIAASWAALQLGDIPLPEDTAKNLALNALEETGVSLTEYLDENPAP